MKGKFNLSVCFLFSAAVILKYSKGNNREYSNSSNVENTQDGSEIWGLHFADGMVSVDCLRCLCLKQSNCEPVGCEMRLSLLQCGYFQITYAIWYDCGGLGSEWKKCADDVKCSSQCLQNYMKRYAQRNNCLLTCEGYSRELFGGPTGCNNPSTEPYWNALQNVPGCKGVE
ncbi:lysozyme-like [Ruditapes philippinarum]|uniref:lysozyme-like n=1 Tax=Ruditapes philippinarum TaxID=129788 RepID=UPI00295C14F9|nr:lysozyme-like [Ruditapes philippinarum]